MRLAKTGSTCPSIEAVLSVWGNSRPKVEGLEIRPFTLTLALVATLALAGDAPAGGISDEPCPNVAGEHTNTCPAGTLGTDYSLTFVETDGSGCGPGEQTFHFDSGVLPAGLALASDGTLSGTPTQLGTFRFYVEMREPQDDPAHCAGKRTQKQFTLTICRELGITSSPLQPPRSERGARFEMTLSVCGARGTVRWNVSAGALPPGLSLRFNGTIAGIPRAAGVYRFTAAATDALSQKLNYAGTIRVAPPLRVASGRVADARVRRAYRAALVAHGGVSPFVWKVVRGNLPRGLRLDQVRGVIRGTPKKEGTYRPTLEVRDALGVRARRALQITVFDRRTPRA